MSRFVVKWSDQAQRELDDIAEWWSSRHSDDEARRWSFGISELIGQLNENPYRWALAWEDEDFPYEVRELHFGLSSRPTHRVVFSIRDETVTVLTIRHVARDRITPDDVHLD